MKRFRTSLAAKTAAVLLALAVGAGGFWSTVFILYQWDTLWLGSGYYDSNDYYSDLYNRSSQVHELARLLQNQEWNGALPYLDQRRLDMLEEALSPERTNFRFAIRRNDTGTLVYSNLEGAASLDESVHAVEQEELSLTQNGAAREQDYVVWNGKEQYYLLYIALPDAAGTKQLVTPEDAGLAAGLCADIIQHQHITFMKYLGLIFFTSCPLNLLAYHVDIIRCRDKTHL